MKEERAGAPPPSFLSSPRSPRFTGDVCIGVRGLRGGLRCPSVPYLPQPFSHSFPNACIIFLAEVLLLPRATPLRELSPKYSALICSRTNLPRSRRQAAGSQLCARPPGKCSSLLLSDPQKHSESSVGRALPSTSGLQLWFQRIHAKKSLLGCLVSGQGDPLEVAGTTFPKMPRDGFRSALSRDLIEIFPSIRRD